VPGGNYAGGNVVRSLAEWARVRKKRIEIFLGRRSAATFRRREARERKEEERKA
jgi:hypothetical protein